MLVQCLDSKNSGPEKLFCRRRKLFAVGYNCFFIACAENLHHLVLVGIKTNKMQGAVNAFKLVEG